MCCVVPGCSLNYRGEHSTIVFNFPKDVDPREKWFRAIPRPRQDYQKNHCIKFSFAIDSDLFIKAFHQQNCQIQLSIQKLSDIRQIETLLGEIESFSDSPQSQISKSSQLSVKSYVEMAINNLEHAIKLIEHNDDDDDDELDPVQTETVQNSPK